MTRNGDETMTSTVTFTKSGKWDSFSGPSYDVRSGNLRIGSIIGGYCWKGGGCRSQGRKTRDYTVFVNGSHVGHVFTLESAKEIARRATDSIGYTTSLQPNGTIAVFNAEGAKVYEADWYYSIAAKYPSAGKPV